MAHFDEVLELVLSSEGSIFVNLALDRGGPTRFGITQSTLALYRNQPVSVKDVAQLTAKEAKDIYEKLYWKELQGDLLLNDSLALCLLDQSVLRGIKAAVIEAQTLLSLKRDGVLGPKTLMTLNQLGPKLLSFLIQFIANAQVSLVQIVERQPSQIAFLEGWIKRTQFLLNEVLTNEGILNKNK